MDFDNIETWEDIKERPDLKDIYSEGEVEALKLPWEVRSALGQFLCDATLDKNTAQQKSKFLDEISEQLNKDDNEVAKEQWSLLASTKTRDTGGNLRKHTRTSLYDVVKSCVERERELVEAGAPASDEDIAQFLDQPEVHVQESISSYSDEFEAVGESMDEDIDPAFLQPTKSAVPECAIELFKTLSSFS